MSIDKLDFYYNIKKFCFHLNLKDRAKRALLREERAQLIAEGKEIPPELMNGLRQEE